MNMIVFFHGLESKQKSDKYFFLKKTFDNIYVPAMDYFSDPNVFTDQYKFLKSQKPKILIGSSMGGYFAYFLGKLLDVPTLLFNPALPYRSFEPQNVSKSGIYSPLNIVVLGTHDTVIDPKDTESWLVKNDKPSNYQIFYEEMGHRTPIDIFKKYVYEYCSF